MERETSPETSTSSETSSRPADAESAQRTRFRLLEAAGRLFADKGYRETTGREICDAAGANLAAINYHFGSKEELYVEALRCAHRRLISREEIEKAIAAGTADEKLAFIVHRVIRGLLGGSADDWHGRLIVRELMTPGEALQTLIEGEIRPKAELLRGVVAELTGLDPAHRAVALGAVSIVSQCLSLYQNRALFERLFPEIPYESERLDAVADHVVRFSRAGLRAVARDQKTPTPGTRSAPRSGRRRRR